MNDEWSNCFSRFTSVEKLKWNSAPCRFLDNRLFATCSDDTTIALWDLRKLNSKVCSLHGHASWVKNIEYDTNTRLLVTSGFDGNVITWDTNRLVSHHINPATLQHLKRWMGSFGAIIQPWKMVFIPRKLMIMMMILTFLKYATNPDSGLFCLVLSLNNAFPHHVPPPFCVCLFLCRFTEDGCPHKKFFHTRYLMRMRLTPDCSKMLISTSSGYLLILHDLDLTQSLEVGSYRMLRARRTTLSSGEITVSLKK